MKEKRAIAVDNCFRSASGYEVTNFKIKIAKVSWAIGFDDLGITFILDSGRCGTASENGDKKVAGINEIFTLVAQTNDVLLFKISVL